MKPEFWFVNHVLILGLVKDGDAERIVCVLWNDAGPTYTVGRRIGLESTCFRSKREAVAYLFSTFMDRS